MNGEYRRCSAGECGGQVRDYVYGQAATLPTAERDPTRLLRQEFNFSSVWVACHSLYSCTASAHPATK